MTVDTFALKKDLKQILEQKDVGKNTDVYSFTNPDLPDTYFQLWWEYLRRSVEYKEFCKAKRDEDYLEFLVKFDPESELWLEDIYVSPYDDFQEWLKYIKETSGLVLHSLRQKSLVSYREYELQDLKNTIRYLELKLKRTPELKDLLLYYEYAPNHRNETYIIEPWNLPPKETVKLVKDKIKEYEFRKPPIQYEQLGKYLKIYDLKQEGKTTPEIAQAVYPNHTGDVEHIARDIRKSLSKAKTIIRNARKGQFPGPY